MNLKKIVSEILIILIKVVLIGWFINILALIWLFPYSNQLHIKIILSIPLIIVALLMLLSQLDED